MIRKLSRHPETLNRLHQPEPGSVVKKKLSWSLLVLFMITLPFVLSSAAWANAVYDPLVGAPQCSTVGSLCDSVDLLTSRGTIDVPEANQPNTIDGCADGNFGYYQSDESIDRISVQTLDGSDLQAGKTVRVDVTVYAFNSDDTLDIYHAAHAWDPEWIFIQSIPAPSPGFHTLSVQYTLPAGPFQAVRASFRYNGSEYPCPDGPFDEADDLAFAVGTAAEYNADLGAPECPFFTAECDSEALLDSRGNLSPAEPNQPNTLDNCTDSSTGLYHDDESIDRIVVSSVDGPVLMEGSTAKIEVTAWAYDFWASLERLDSNTTDFSNYLDFYYAADADNPTWTYITSVWMLDPGPQTHSVQFTLPDGHHQAVRVRLRFGGPAGACPTGDYNEADDLAFAVAPGDTNGDGVNDLDEFTFCEDETDPDCSRLSYQLHLASAMILFEELPESTFDSYMEQVEQDQLTAQQACEGYVTVAHQQATNEDLHPYPLSDYLEEICPATINVPNDRRTLKEQDSLCFFNTGHQDEGIDAWFAHGGTPSSRPRDLDPTLLLYSEKILARGSLSESVCTVYNFLSKAGRILDDPRLTENYNPRFVSMLQEYLMMEVLTRNTPDHDSAEARRVLLEAAFPEFMYELQAGQTFGLNLFNQLKRDMYTASLPLSNDSRDAILNAETDLNREESAHRKLGGVTELSFRAYYTSISGMPLRKVTSAAVTAYRMKHVSYIVQAWKSGVFSDSITMAGVKIAKVSGGVATSLVSALHQAIYNIKVSLMLGPDLGLLSGSEISQLEENMNLYLLDVQQTHDVTISGPAGNPLDSGLYESLSAPFQAVIEQDNKTEGYLDFSQTVGGLPKFLAQPSLQCDEESCWSDLVQLSENARRGLRDDCVSLVETAGELEYVQSQCDNEVPILCNEVQLNSDGTTSIVGNFITAGKHSLWNAHVACQSERTLGSDRMALAASTNSAGILTEPGLGSTLESDGRKYFGTGLVICDETPESDPTKKAGYNYTTCAGSTTTDVSGASPASCDVPVEGTGGSSGGGSGGSGSDRCPEDEPGGSSGGSGEPPRKKGRFEQDKYTAGATNFADFFNRVLTEQKKKPKLNFLNIYTLPVGQGSCHVLQCVEPTLDGSSATVKNILYDCGTTAKFTVPASPFSQFMTPIADLLNAADRYLLGWMTKKSFLGAPPELAIISHTDDDHNNLLTSVFAGADPSTLPQKWILGGRVKDIPKDGKVTPTSSLDVIRSRVLGGHPVKVNAIDIDAGETAIKTRMMAYAEGHSENNISDALESCGATVDLITVNAGIAPETQTDVKPPQKNVVSTVVAVKVDGKMIALFPGDGIRGTWNSVESKASGLFSSYPIRFLASAHHGAFREGANDSKVRDLVMPTHVVFSHARARHGHVHSRAWQAFWPSNGATDYLAKKDDETFPSSIYLTEALQFGETLGDSSRPADADAYIGPVSWNPDNLPNFQDIAYKNYLVDPTDVFGRALLGTHTNGLILTTLATLKPGQTGEAQAFTIRRFNFDLANFDAQFNEVMFKEVIGSP